MARRVRIKDEPPFFTHDRVYGYVCAAIYTFVCIWAYQSAYAAWMYYKRLEFPEQNEIQATLWLLMLAACFSFIVSILGAITSIKMSQKMRISFLCITQYAVAIFICLSLLAPMPPHLDAHISHPAYLAILPLLLSTFGAFLPKIVGK